MDISTPITEEVAASLQVGGMITLSGYILCGRDAVCSLRLAQCGKGSGCLTARRKTAHKVVFTDPFFPFGKLFFRPAGRAEQIVDDERSQFLTKLPGGRRRKQW